ncbi:maleylpyruvate isomerase N-terminal domain-containing protein [Streptomyces sp. 8K308]|uniref:maleylpyruvate isomerase N-terminal domain-containing protein n=1 Tax=Streptomyces sp. 8K308 TaxID=2530388 RepID=UPI00326666B7
MVDDYAEEIVRQTESLRETVRGGDARARVPSCPEWNLGQLVRHVGGTHRWAERCLRAGGAEVWDEQVNKVGSGVTEDLAALDGWLAAGAERLAARCARSARRPGCGHRRRARTQRGSGGAG